MGSLMEQHLLARHLATKAGSSAVLDDISMPLPSSLQGQVCWKHMQIAFGMLTAYSYFELTVLPDKPSRECAVSNAPSKDLQLAAGT